MTSIKYDHLQDKETVTGKFHQNPLKTVGGVAETRLCLRTDGLTNEPRTIVSFDLRRRTKTVQKYPLFMLWTGPYQVSLEQQIRFYSKTFDNKRCRYNEGIL